MKSNFTNVWGHTWQNSVEIAFVAANCFVLLVTLHIGIFANFFVTWAVYHQKSLQTSNNALLVNLAVIDILRCVIDCPLLLAIVLSARNARDLGPVFCSAQIASFSLICCVQLLTLACISAERYQAIAHPFKTTERRKRIMIWIPMIWLVPICLSVLCVIFAKDSPVYVKCRGLRVETLHSYDTFGFYILTPIWTVCLAVIIGFYARIFLLVRAHSRKIFDKGSFPPPDKKKEDKKKHEETKTTGGGMAQTINNNNDHSNLHQKESLRDLNTDGALEKTLDFQTTEHQPFGTTSSDLSQPKNVLEKPPEMNVTFQDELSNEAPRVTDLEDAAESSSAPQDAAAETSSPANGEEGVEPNEPQEAAPAETSPSANEEIQQVTEAPKEEDVAGAVCMMPSLAQRERGNAKKESKLAKRSGYIIFTFLVFWIPLIATVLLNHFLVRKENLTVEVFREMEILTVSLVSMTSLTNPIIYAAVNPQFRTEFHNLKTKCKAHLICSS